MIDVVMPQMGESIVEGTLTKWLKKPGERSGATSRCSRSRRTKWTPKFRLRRPAMLAEVLIEEGKTVGINTVVARINDGARRGLLLLPLLRRPAPAPPPPAPVAEAAWLARNLVATVVAEDRRSAFAAGAQDGSREQYRPEPGEGHGRREPHHEAGYGKVSGIEEALRRKRDRLRQQRTCAYSAAGTACAASSATTAVAPHSADGADIPSPMPGARVEQMTTMRQKIAEHMVFSKRTSAHVTTVHKVDLTKIAKVRDKAKAAFQAQYGFSLTFLPFVCSATCIALRQFPLLNASIEGDEHHLS